MHAGNAKMTVAASGSMPKGALEELRSKYAEILEMRVDHASGSEDAAHVRARMARLACRFPGALREMDDLPMCEITQRLADLDRVLRGALEPLPWMAAISLFHASARGALCAKRWLAGRKLVDAGLRLAYVGATASLAFPEEALAWAGELEAVARPPRGRLTDLVFARVAVRLGTTAAAARRLAFGVARRERR